MKQRWSLLALLACWLLQLYAGLFYYPKWNKPYTEATISWDVSGYYLYLPALFIYNDIKQLEFKDDVMNTYGPTSDFHQAFMHRSGSYVMKYPSGMAVQYLPAFAVGHFAAGVGGYPADGFSRPYQLAINVWSLLVALFGVLLLRKVLLKYFSDVVTALTLISIVFATNYLNYSAIDGALTHNYLFTLYAFLLWVTIRFYERPSTWRAVGIGAILGLTALSRPTEIIAVIIPVLWGLRFPLWAGLKERLQFVRQHFSKFLTAAVVCFLIGSIQLIYWKAVSGEWLVYSYQDQEFSWLRPHLKDGLLSYNSGWLIYTPVMVFALIGFAPLFKQHRQTFVPTVLFFVVFTYICVAWDVWWYGASLGNRAMVQAYPILALPLAAFLASVLKRRSTTIIVIALIAFFSYYNFWLTHQAHKGRLYHAGQMNSAFFWKTVLRNTVDPNDIKLLDNSDHHRGDPTDMKLLLTEDFESDTLLVICSIEPIDGMRSSSVCGEQQFSSEISVGWDSQRDWVRASAVFRVEQKEWDVWRMTQFTVRFTNNGEVVKERRIRLQRLLSDHETKEIFMDVRAPSKPADKVSVFLWNAGSEKPLVMDNLRIEGFN